MRKIMDGDFISYTRMSILSKYYIQGYGRVSSFSNASKVIDMLYKKAPIK
jgi:hypothetical protein